MNWLLRLLGSNAGDIPEDARAELVWENLPSSWGVFLLLAFVVGIAWLVLWLYRRETVPDRPPREKWIRRALAALRLATLATLLFIFLGPAIRVNRRDVLKPNIVVLRDASTSMAEKDKYVDDRSANQAATALDTSVKKLRNEPPARAELVNAILAEDDHRLQRELEKLGNLRAFDFSDSLTRVDKFGQLVGDNDPNSLDNLTNDVTTTREPLPPLVPNGPASDIFSALREGLNDKQTAAIVLFSDGQHTAGGALAEAARDAKAKKIPLLVVGTGDPTPPRNLSISDLYADPQVWKDDPFELQATITSEGVGPETVEVEFYELGGFGDGAGGVEDGSETSIETRTVQLPEEDGPLRLSFRHSPGKPGRHAYGVRVVPIEDEHRTEDNAAPAPAIVKVLDNQAKVLLIAGGPSWEYRNLSVLLTREKFIEVSCWLQSIDDGRAQAGNQAINELPETKEDLFAYDVIMMLDPDPTEFSPEWIELLKEFVREHAGGVLYQAGPRYAGRFLGGDDTGAVRDLLPVRLGDVADLEVQTMLSVSNQELPIRPFPANADHPILRFYQDSDQNTRRWQTLPGVYWSFPAEEAKPAAKVLLERRGGGLERPLIVSGRFGSGRTAYLGFTGTWRWRPIGRENEFYNSFWVQTARWLVEGRAMEGRRRGTIETEQQRYQVGDRVQIVGKLKDEQFNPLEDAEVLGTLKLPNGDTQDLALKAVPNQPGRYQSTAIAQMPGPHFLAIELDSRDGPPTRMEIDFAVTLPQVETRAVWLNEPQLRELAEISGGSYYNVSTAAKLYEAIPNRTRVLETQGPATPIWDNLRILLFLVLLLALEWWFRKRYKLL